MFMIWAANCYEPTSWTIIGAQQLEKVSLFRRANFGPSRDQERRGPKKRTKEEEQERLGKSLKSIGRRLSCSEEHRCVCVCEKASLSARVPAASSLPLLCIVGPVRRAAELRSRALWAAVCLQYSVGTVSNAALWLCFGLAECRGKLLARDR